MHDTTRGPHDTIAAGSQPMTVETSRNEEAISAGAIGENGWPSAATTIGTSGRTVVGDSQASHWPTATSAANGTRNLAEAAIHSQ